MDSIDYNDAEMAPAAQEVSDGDEDDDRGNFSAHSAAASSNQPVALDHRKRKDGLDLDDLIIFRVPHKHPHMLKRPLQHVDGLNFMDMAVRVYEVCPALASDHDMVPRPSSVELNLFVFFSCQPLPAVPDQIPAFPGIPVSGQ